MKSNHAHQGKSISMSPHRRQKKKSSSSTSHITYIRRQHTIHMRTICTLTMEMKSYTTNIQSNGRRARVMSHSRGYCFLFAAAKQYVTTTTMTVNEKQPQQQPTTWRTPETPEMTEKHNSHSQLDSALDEEEREERLARAEREYAQNLENGRGHRGKQSVRDSLRGMVGVG